MKKEILNKISKLKKQLLAEGFVIEGVFGSYRRDESDTNSDIDILYDLDNVFRDKYKGFKAVARIDAIQEYISSILGIQADLVQKKYLGTVSAKYILPEVHYVD